MSRAELWTVCINFVALSFLAAIIVLSSGAHPWVPLEPSLFFALFGAVMVLDLAAVVITARDLWLRDELSPRDKLRWVALVWLTGTLAWPFYIALHAKRPRGVRAR